MFSSMKWQFYASIISMIMGMIQISILARYLKAEDLGSLAIVMIFVNLLQAISDCGLSNYLVYRGKDTTSVENSTIFFVGITISIAVILLINIFSPLLTLVYSIKVMNLVTLLSFNCLSTGFISQIQAMFYSNLCFTRLAKIEIFSKLISVLIVTLMVRSDFGLESVVYGVYGYSFVKMTLLWTLAEKDWLPKVLFNKEIGMKGLKFGVYQTGTIVLGQIRQNIDTIIMSMFLNVHQLGYYNLAKQLACKPSQLIAPVFQKTSLPHIAIHKFNKDKLTIFFNKQYYLNVFFLSMFYMVVIFKPESIIHITYGENYINEVSDILMILSVMWFLRTISSSFIGPLCQGFGETKKEFKWNIFIFIINVPLLFFVARYGLFWMVCVMLSFQIILFVAVYFYFYKNVVDMHFSKYIFTIFNAVLVMMAVSFVSNTFLYNVDIKDYKVEMVLWSILACSLFYAISYLLQMKHNYLLSVSSIYRILFFNDKK